MADRQLKRKITNSLADDTVKDFNDVDSVQVRRQSGWGEHKSEMREESWMAKVSLAISSRIFSGETGSRSTQVIPMGSNDNSQASLPSSSLELSEVTITSHKSYHDLRHVASEVALSNTPPVATFRSGLTVTCNFAPDDSDDSISEVEDEDKCRWSSHRSTPRRPCSSPIVQKVRPGFENDEAEEEKRETRATKVTAISTRILRSYDAEVSEQSAAPILKGFFNKTLPVSKENRIQQQQQRREVAYREIKQRQDKLREQTDREQAANEKAYCRRKVGQLRRINQQRRLELLRGIGCARKVLLERVREDSDMYQAERNKWENDFENEMQVLSAAFRKARTTDENRPVTVAGLALPEALSQLERDASNFEKRVKTAQPALASMNTRPHSEASSSRNRLSFPLFESCEVLAREDSIDVFDLLGNDQTTEFFPNKNSSERTQHNHDIHQLLSEREQLLQRLAAIDRIVQNQQQ
ncbi:hypothetical protein DVH05_010198 [Phytophthora capsici]|nr:hypothetical protein DVH05_010198 [Phytophthora capsici]